VYHVLNRANGRLRIFRKASDFLAFEKILADAMAMFSMRLCGYCIMEIRGKYRGIRGDRCLLWTITIGDCHQLLLVFLQFDNDYIRIRIACVFADVDVAFHPDNTPCFDVKLLLATVRECQTSLE